MKFIDFQLNNKVIYSNYSLNLHAENLICTKKIKNKIWKFEMCGKKFETVELLY